MDIFGCNFPDIPEEKQGGWHKSDDLDSSIDSYLPRSPFYPMRALELNNKDPWCSSSLLLCYNMPANGLPQKHFSRSCWALVSGGRSEEHPIPTYTCSRPPRWGCFGPGAATQVSLGVMQ